MNLSYTNVFDVFAQKHGLDARERGTLFACTHCVYMGLARTMDEARAVARHIALKHKAICNDKVFYRYSYSNSAPVHQCVTFDVLQDNSFVVCCIPFSTLVIKIQ